MEKPGVDIAELVVQAGLAKTKSEARRAIEQGAVRIEDQKIEHPFARLCMKGDKWAIWVPK